MTQRLINGNLHTDYVAVLNKSTVAYTAELLGMLSKVAKRGFDDQCYLQAYSYCYDYTRRTKPDLTDDAAGTVALKALIKHKVGSTLEDVFFWGIANCLGNNYLKGVERQKIIKTDGRTIKPDYCWERIHLIVECDGEEYHSKPEDRENDRVKTLALNGLGYTVIRYTYKQIMYSPDEVFKHFAEVYAELTKRYS